MVLCVGENFCRFDVCQSIVSTFDPMIQHLKFIWCECPALMIRFWFNSRKVDVNPPTTKEWATRMILQYYIFFQNQHDNNNM